jgi:hypothetical protein
MGIRIVIEVDGSSVKVTSPADLAPAASAGAAPDLTAGAPAPLQSLVAPVQAAGPAAVAAQNAGPAPDLFAETGTLSSAPLGSAPAAGAIDAGPAPTD